MKRVPGTNSTKWWLLAFDFAANQRLDEVWYAVSGTDLVYGAMAGGGKAPQGELALWYPPTCWLCDARY
eukprot:2333409-Rhodomonas_salina.1